MPLEDLSLTRDLMYTALTSTLIDASERSTEGSNPQQYNISSAQGSEDTNESKRSGIPQPGRNLFPPTKDTGTGRGNRVNHVMLSFLRFAREDINTAISAITAERSGSLTTAENYTLDRVSHLLAVPRSGLSAESLKVLITVIIHMGKGANWS